MLPRKVLCKVKYLTSRIFITITHVEHFHPLLRFFRTIKFVNYSGIMTNHQLFQRTWLCFMIAPTEKYDFPQSYLNFNLILVIKSKQIFNKYVPLVHESLFNILSSFVVDLVLGYYMPLIISESWSCTITLWGKRPWENESGTTGKDETGIRYPCSETGSLSVPKLTDLRLTLKCIICPKHRRACIYRAPHSISDVL